MADSWNDMADAMQFAKDALSSTGRVWLVLIRDSKTNASLVSISEMSDDDKLHVADALRKIAEQLSRL